MIKVNCAALPSSLIESELFGREKGAFTGAVAGQMGRFEAADGSTIFLDEIGALPLDLQAKLLRVLQDGSFERLGSPKTLSVDVRIIAATNQDLTALPRTLEEIDRNHILEVLNKTGWRVSGPLGAARRLGLKESTLRWRMQKLGIARPTG